MIWTLTVILFFDWGMPDDRLVLVQARGYSTAEDCVTVGQSMAEWLTQDGVRAVFSCREGV